MKIVSEPTTENTIYYNEFQASSPERYSLDDKLVVFANGGFVLSISTSPTIIINGDEAITNLINHVVTVYVVANGLIISGAGRAVEVPFQYITLYALRSSDQLLVQIQSNELIQATSTEPVDYDPTVDIILSPSDSHGTLFAKACSTTELYQAMNQCSDEQDHEDDKPVFDPVQDMEWSNTGDADDLGPELEEVDKHELGHGEAAMNVDILGPVAGTKRSLEDGNGMKRFKKI